MSTPKSNVDERVVQMRFDNAQFEKNVATTRLSLDKLNKSLELKDAGKGIQNIDSAIRNVDFAGFSSGIETLHSKFSALEVMGITAIANITNSAIAMGSKIASALTIEPVHTGFQEYETQINAIQTILANTESKGSTLKDVNEALNELNHYADMTIYNFTEMTRNIGTFTAAGVDLETSVAAIKGIANLAAVSGSTSQQASTAMYQLSQALASGTVKLQDWNSVVNAGMGGQVFQDALKETARVHSVNIDAMIKKEGSFRETLKKGWLTSSILTETLSKFTGDLTESQLKEIGYTDKQIKSIVKMGQTANDAATKVKTLSQLIDTSKEAAQSGWTKTWELIVGDFDEAKEFFTWLSDSVSNGINASSDKRNNLLEGALLNNWTKLTKAINKAGVETQTFEDKVKSIGKKQGYDIGKLVKEYGSLDKVFKNGAVSANVLKDAFKELMSATSGLDKIDTVLRKGSSGDDVKAVQKILKQMDFDIGSKVDGILGPQTEEAIKSFQKMKGLSIDGIVGTNTIKALKEATSSTFKLDENINEMIDSVTELGGREKLIESLKNSLAFLGEVAKPIKESFREMFPGITEEELTGVINKIYAFTKNLKLADETADDLRRTFDGGFAILQMFGKGLTVLSTPFKVIFDSGIIGKGVSSFLELTASFGDFLTTLNESENAADVFTTISEGLSDFANGVVTLIDPALSGIENCSGALGYFGNLVLSVVEKVGDGFGHIFEFVTDNVSVKDVLAALIGGGTISLLKEFTNVFGNINEILEKVSNKSKNSSIKEGFADVLSGLKTAINAFASGVKITQILPIAFSLLALTTAIEKLSKIKVEKIAKSLLSLYVSFKMLTSSTEKINDMLSGNRKPIKGLFSTGVLLITLAESLNIFADAVKKISDVPADRIVSSLVILGGGIAMLCLGMQQITKKDSKNVSLSTSIALLTLAESCRIMAEALTSISSLSWEEIGKGLTGMGGALVELVAATSVLGKFGGFGSILGATGILIAVQSLKDISEALSDIGSLSWDQIEKGLTGIGGALTELTVVLAILSKTGGFGSILGATGILIAAQSLNEISDCLSSIGSLSWEEIGKGLTGMGGALVELGSVVGLLGTFGGFGSLISAGSILIAAQSLSDVSVALSSIGSLSWEEIGKGLAGMGGALTELVVACEILGNPNCLSQLVGATTILIAVQSLNEISDCLSSVGSLSWEEIAKGLVGMGGALTEVAVISGLLGSLSGIGGLLGAGSLLIATQGLGDLADALAKFGEMDWETIGRGLTAMGGAMGETALGGVLNTFSGFGASSIEKIATPLGNLADSMKKWSGVVVPDKIGWQLGNLASGVNEFLMSGIGAEAIETLAIPLGNLAMSVMRWKDVVLPDGLRENLKELAEGTNAFMFGGLGSMGMDLIVTPLGQLADSAKKWSGFTLPENIESMMKGLANGVNAFLLTGLSADSIKIIKKPLGELAASASKWKDVVIPENIQSGLEGLANGIKACNGMNVDLQAMSNSVEKIRNVINSLSTVNFEDATSKLSSFGTSLKTLDISSSGESLMASIATGVNKSDSKVYTALLSGISIGLKKITSKKKDFVDCGGVLVTGLATGMKNNSSKVSNSASASALSGVSAARGYRTSFYLAGEYLVSGFASGIRDNIDSAKNAAQDMASAAARAAKKELDEHSPSKVFYGIGDFAGLGFVNALGDYAEESYKTGQQIASSARSGLEKSFDTVMSLIGDGFDDTPMIRPILDLTRVKEGAGQINSLLGTGQTVQLAANIGAITTAMNNQNGSNDDIISAINRLGKSLGNVGGNNYTINGITYDDGSNVTDAVKSLIRAAKIERRR